MKRSLMLLTALIGLAPLGIAQDFGEEAALIAQRQKLQEDLKRFQATVDALLETQEFLLKRVSSMADEMQALRRRQEETAAASVSREELVRLVERLEKQIDAKREADKKLILEAIAEIRKIASTPVPIAAAEPVFVRPPPVNEPTFEYVVKEGDTVSAIREAYNADYREQGRSTIGLDDIKRVNPRTDLDRIRVGQVIRIPEPK